MNPGRTVFPAKSIFFAAPDASARISSFEPIARKRPPEMASACARGCRGLTVQTFALYRMTSGSVRSSGNTAAALSAPNPYRNSRREVVIFNVLAERVMHPIAKCSGAQYTTEGRSHGREATLSGKKTVVEI